MCKDSLNFVGVMLQEVVKDYDNPYWVRFQAMLALQDVETELREKYYCEVGLFEVV